MSKTNESLSDNSLTTEQIETYRDLGYLVVPKLFDPGEVERFAAAVDEEISRRSAVLRPGNLRVRHKAHYQTGELMLEVVDPISDICPAARQIALDPRIQGVLSSIYGEGPYLFKDKYFYKPSGSLGIDLHQDWICWPGFPKSFITVLLAIDPFQEASGGTMVYPRMHRQGYLSEMDGQHHHLAHSRMETRPVCLTLGIGDIAIFGCFTPHYSEPNTTASTRRGYFMSYNSCSEGGDSFRSHYLEFHRWIQERYPEPMRNELFFQ